MKGVFLINKTTFDLFKESYIYELENREKINARVTFPLGIITLLVGLAVFYFNQFEHISSNAWGCFFYIVYSLYLLTLVLGIVLIFKSYYNYKYQYLPNPEEFDNYVKSIISYYDEHYDTFFRDRGDKDSLVNDRINSQLYDYYKSCSTQNFKMNKKKLTYLRFSGYVLVISIFLALISVVPYQLALKETEPTKIEVGNIEKIIFELEKLNKGVK